MKTALNIFFVLSLFYLGFVLGETYGIQHNRANSEAWESTADQCISVLANCVSDFKEMQTLKDEWQNNAGLCLDAVEEIVKNQERIFANTKDTSWVNPNIYPLPSEKEEKGEK